MPSVVNQRVGQLDASLLDSELYEILRKKLLDSFTGAGRYWRDGYEPELTVLLKLALFKTTIWDHSTTYGAKLQNLRFVNAQTNGPLTTFQKLAYGLFVVGGSYSWDRLNSFIVSQSADDRETHKLHISTLQFLVDKLTVISTGVGLLNFIVFLYSGRYSTAILRLLRIKLQPTSRILRREPNLEFQNRQLVWNAMTEFLIFILPLVNWPKLKNRISRYFQHRLNAKNSQDFSEIPQLAYLPEKTCAICYQAATSGSAHTDITNPYVGECGHTYCYICIKTKLSEDDEGFNCLRCGFLIKTAKPFVDILESSIKTSSTMTDSGSYDKIDSDDLKEESENETDQSENIDDNDEESPDMNFIVEEDL